MFPGMAIPIPPERVPPIAKEVSSSKTTWAILFWFGMVLAAITGLGMQPEHGDRSSMFAGFAFWVIVLFALGVKQYKVARRANAAVRLADDPTVTWVLAGRELVAYRSNGISMPDASFKLSTSHVTMLTALPKAELKQ